MRHGIGIMPGVGPHQQVVANAQQRENFPPLGHMGNTALHNGGGVLGRDVLALVEDAAFARVDDAGDGFQNGRFARAIGAQHRDNFTRVHIQTHAAYGFDGAVIALHVEQLQQWGLAGGHGAGLRKWLTSSALPK